MKNEYFETVFCPHLSQLKQLEVFQQSNCRMEAFTMEDLNVERNMSVTIFKSCQEQILTDPHGLNAYIIRVMNEGDITRYRTRDPIGGFRIANNSVSIRRSAVIQREL